jgi:hypothetical protein
MNFPHTQIANLKTLGYTEREARFLYIVAIHSGYFTQTQLCPFIGSKSGRTTRSFTSRLLSRNHVRERKYQNNASIYHLMHRRIYQAIGQENLRNRRSHTFDFMKIRLAILDFVLSHLEYHFFEGEAEKVQYFEQNLQIRPQEMPGRTYRGSNNVPDTVRYFVDKFPMFLNSTVAGGPIVTFTFIDPGYGNLDAFRTHLDAYAGILQRIPRLAFVFASPTLKLFDSAHQLFQNKINPPTGKLSEQLTRYFMLRTHWEAKRYELLKDPDIEFMNHARQCFAGEAFESAFAEWRAGRITERNLVSVLEARARQKQEIWFSTYPLPRDYSLFGQNSAFLKKTA